MPTDFGKILGKINADNEQLLAGRSSLREAFEKLDGRINAMQAGTRIEPYDVGKSGAKLGFRRYNTGWHISTLVTGIGDIISEIPVIEAGADAQVELMPHVGGLLEKLHAAIASDLKSTSSALKEADRLTTAIRSA